MYYHTAYINIQFQIKCSRFSGQQAHNCHNLWDQGNVLFFVVVLKKEGQRLSCYKRSWPEIGVYLNILSKNQNEQEMKKNKLIKKN